MRALRPALPSLATLTPQAARAGGASERDRAAQLAGLLWCALCAGALAMAVGATLGRAPLNLYDVSFSLDWGSDLLHGLVPDVHVSGASTPHPLSIVSGALAALFGSSALDVMRAMLLACTGAAAVALYRIGALASSRLAGVVAVAVLLLSEPFLYATVGQATPSDLPSLAAVLAALACELARPKRAVAPLVLLSFAGLWRPEPWLLAALYWAWVARGRPLRARVGLGAIALSAPALWMAGDLAMTHDPFYSLTYTHESALAGQRPTGLSHAAEIMKTALVSYLGTPALIASLAAVAIELLQRRLPRLLLVLLALSVLSFALIGAAGLPLQERYALPTTVLLAVFFGHLAAGWRKLPRSPLRHLWMLAALVAVAAMLANTPRELHAFASDRATFARQSAIIGDLGKLTRSHGLRARLRACTPVAAPYRVVPILAYDIGQRPRELTTQDTGIPAYGALVLPNNAAAAQLFETHRFLSYSLARHGYVLLAQNASWKIWTRCAAA
jgi:hypothetical protein